jgi:putative transposase
VKCSLGDITYLPLRGGEWAYLATWQDLFSRRVVGWQVAATMTAELVTGTINKVLVRERPAPGLILHSDRGGQYVAAESRALLDRHGCEQSMSRAGETYDNLAGREPVLTLQGGTARRRGVR